MFQSVHRRGSRDLEPPPNLKTLEYEGKQCSFKYDVIETWTLLIHGNAQFVSFSLRVARSGGGGGGGKKKRGGSEKGE